MSIINRVVLQEYQYTIGNFGPNMATFEPGVAFACRRFVVTIHTNDGLSGSYAPHFGATSQILAQVKQMAPTLIGIRATQRELVFERLKLMFRHFDKAGIAVLDAALWDLAGKHYGASVAELLGATARDCPFTQARRQVKKHPADSIALRGMRSSLKRAWSTVLPHSRFIVFLMATRAPKSTS